MKRTNYKNLDEDHLLSCIRLGDELAFRFFYDNYRSQIYHVALQYLKSKEVAKEVVQDVFLKIWVDKDGLADVKCLKSWLYRVTKNNVLNKLKRIAVESKAKEYFSLRTELLDTNTEDQLHAKDYQSLLQDAINSLPEQQKKVFELARHDNLTYDKIGEKLHLSPLTVKTHMARALQAIRAKISRNGLEIPLFLIFIEDFF
ncbi:RNA polymerase sigma-70 factor [Sphingobacterium bovistauri]|uniref:RNA polymerase sigma-70 factor n=1 Tax=Sphingobacterium bovistauri TaxID=2781959 RepID=A0ABS7Z0N3_9SPHI|nr:RNA polymerase sigma-70 factor [Sphingobacterium bovistauri]MCA5003720.1 RNA polymerase sigma-70 factor [Sphingobacterium bovistauri]